MSINPLTRTIDALELVVTKTKSEFGNELNIALQQSILHCLSHGDSTNVSKILSLISKSQLKLAKGMIEKYTPLYFDVKGKIKLDREAGSNDLQIYKVRPFTQVDSSFQKDENLIVLDKKELSVHELHSLLIDSLTLYRNKFSEDEFTELLETIELVNASRARNNNRDTV